MEAERLLKQLNIAYSPLSDEQTHAHKLAWVQYFLPPEKHQKAIDIYCLPNDDGYSDYLWHAFSFELLDGLCNDDARTALNNVENREVILLSNWDDTGFHISDASALTASNLEEIDDVVVTSVDFKWTYAKTHESALGPYFFKMK